MTEKEIDIQQYAAESFMLYVAHKEGRNKLRDETLKMIEESKKGNQKSGDESTRSVWKKLEEKIKRKKV